MKYILATPALDAQIAEIRIKIRLSMNGIVSDKMTQSGIHYKKNYGVSIPRIKEIASGYVPNHDLAERLWLLGIRETMIMATLLEPIDKLTPEMAQYWVSRLTQIEIVEHACMNMFCKLPFARSLCVEWVKSDQRWMQISGFVLAARVFLQLNSDEITVITRQVMEASITADFHLYKAMALCLCRFCRKDKETANNILTMIEPVSGTASAAQQFIYNEVKQEILFLDIL